MSLQQYEVLSSIFTKYQKCRFLVKFTESVIKFIIINVFSVYIFSVQSHQSHKMNCRLTELSYML